MYLCLDAYRFDCLWRLVAGYGRRWQGTSMSDAISVFASATRNAFTVSARGQFSLLHPFAQGDQLRHFPEEQVLRDRLRVG